MCLTPWSASARTIIAAPVIWLGSWLFRSLMAGSGCALWRWLGQYSLENKKGPRGPCTPPEWMASATPGGAPGYDENQQLGNFIAHQTAPASQRLRET